MQPERSFGASNAEKFILAQIINVCYEQRQHSGEPGGRSRNAYGHKAKRAKQSERYYRAGNKLENSGKEWHNTSAYPLKYISVNEKQTENEIAYRIYM